MVFAVCQLQEICREQNKDLHLVSVDLTKVFSTVKQNVRLEFPQDVQTSSLH